MVSEEHPGALHTAAELASTWSDQGKHADAEKIRLEVLATRKRVLGEEHPDTLRSAAN